MQAPHLSLEPLWHGGNYCIAVRGRLSPAADQVIRIFPNRRFSKTHACWYVAYSPETLALLHQRLKLCQPVEVPNDFEGRPASYATNVTVLQFPLPEGYHDALIRMRYSEATLKTYESQMRLFLSYLHPRTIAEATDVVIHKYLLYLTEKRKVSVSTQNTAINAVKFYFEKVLRKERKEYYIERPMKETKLPQVLNDIEVTNLIEMTKNVKHRCMLLLLYSAGLRMAELLNLRWRDFDERRMQLFVNGGKGKKDRFTLLSTTALAHTQYYMSMYEPKDFLFEGPGRKAYSPRSVNMIIHRSAALAGIKKNVTAHTLRHSFGTHLLEQGVDIRYIQVLLGHESSKTTERYTHMTTRGFSKIKSPLDQLKTDFSTKLLPIKKTE